MVNEYTTLSLVQAEIRAATAFSSSTTPTSAQVTTWIQEASREVELRSGTVFSSTVANSQYFDYDGSGIFRFPQKPILSITSVEYNTYGNNVSPNWVSLESGYGKNYLEYLDEGEIEFIGGQDATNKVTPAEGKKKLRLSYSYGYATTPLEIQRLTTLITAKRVIGTLANSQSNTEGGDVQVGSIRVSDPTNYSLSYMKDMNNEINTLFNSLGQSQKTYVINRLY